MAPRLFTALVILGLATPVVGPFAFAECSLQTNDLAACCYRVKLEAVTVCQSYRKLGFSCTQWSALMDKYCSSSCGNCSYLGANLLMQCDYSLAQKLTNETEIANDCAASQTEFEHYRCHSACEMDFNVECNSPEGRNCMNLCGNYAGCSCKLDRVGKDPPLCTGYVLMQGPDRIRPGFNYSCQTMPNYCMNSGPEGTCGKYQYCPPNYCLIKGVDLTPSGPNAQCQEYGTCDPLEGFAVFANKPDGSPCNDGFNWTLNDTCQTGFCVGNADLCLKYDVQCSPLNNCLTGGVCHKSSGRCTFDFRPDYTPCDDGIAQTVQDHCMQSVCVGTYVDLCKWNGVNCTAPTGCYSPGTCDPTTGLCSAPALLNGASCSDGLNSTTNDTCINGICVGQQVCSDQGPPRYQTLGAGDCTDRFANRMSRYSGNVGSKNECEAVCSGDLQCLAYAYTFPLCIIYGMVRKQAPGNRFSWVFQEGTDPPAIAIETATTYFGGQRNTVCRRKGCVGDVTTNSGQPNVSAQDFFGPVPLGCFFLVALGIFFFRSIFDCMRRFVRGPPPEEVQPMQDTLDLGQAALADGEEHQGMIDDLRNTAALSTEAEGEDDENQQIVELSNQETPASPS